MNERNSPNWDVFNQKEVCTWFITSYFCFAKLFSRAPWKFKFTPLLRSLQLQCAYNTPCKLADGSVEIPRYGSICIFELLLSLSLTVSPERTLERQNCQTALKTAPSKIENSMTQISDITISLKKAKTYKNAFEKFSQKKDDFEEEFQSIFSEFPTVKQLQRRIEYCQKKLQREEKVLRLIDCKDTEHRKNMAKMRIKCYKESLESEKKALKTEISRIKAELPETFLTISKALNALEFLFPQICAEYKSLQLALEELHPR